MGASGRPSGKARGVLIPGVCTRRATPRAGCIEVPTGTIPSQVERAATVVRLTRRSPGDDVGAIAATVGDYTLWADWDRSWKLQSAAQTLSTDAVTTHAW